ncbi:alpha/beta hydrolase [Candidatus Entotheonella palauensis]|uniref:alpha/beta hydrolase n=1 Tax=Candidatus Entotheonella palauensis TaxID=93172 RepID=UPI000B7EAE22|nr:alpha/beta hydrolase [Candidatus Entotheonella palauensis]
MLWLGILWLALIYILPLHAGVALGGSHAPGTVDSLQLFPLRIKLKGGELAEAERGMMPVPMKRSEPQSAIIEVEVYRFRTTGHIEARRPPIFILHGGPSFQGLERPLKRPGYYEKHIQPYTDIADVVVVSQRGIGSSNPNTKCRGPETLPINAGYPAKVQAVREASKRCKAHWEGEGYDLSGFTVIEAAGDVNDVRKALGYDRIMMVGHSFGSHWGMAVLRYHPAIVARAVLAGLEGPDHTYDMPSEVFNALKRMAAAAETASDLNGYIPAGGLIQAFETVIGRAEKAPVVADGVRFDAAAVRDLALGYTRRVYSRQDVSTWPTDILALYAGDFSKAARIRQHRHRRRSSHFPTASLFMLDCGSGISASRQAQLRSDPAVAVVGPIGWFYQATCPIWGSDLGEAFRQNFETIVPTVLVHGTWDVSTPYENVLELAPFFTNAKLITVHGGSHDAYREALEASDGFRQALTAFLKTGSMSDLPDEIRLPPIEWVIPKDKPQATP